MPDLTKFINPAQIGGIEAYTFDEGPARGVRALCVNTGGGLRYRVLVDRGMDIDQAFFNCMSLTFLSHGGVTPPTRALDRAWDWLKGFPVGLLASGGPFNIGVACTDAGEELGLHGTHANTAASIESVIQPDPHAGRKEMSVTALVRYGGFYGPCVTLRRTITSRLGENSISFVDEFHNAGNSAVPHAWLMHINFGYPFVDEGAEFCYSGEAEAIPGSAASASFFSPGRDYKRVPAPLAEHAGDESVVASLFPKPIDSAGNTTVGIVNRTLSLGVAIHYNTREFPRCGNWQHWGLREYVCALEPMNGTVDGRDKDRAAGRLDFLQPDQRKVYRWRMEVLNDPASLDRLLALNARA